MVAHMTAQHAISGDDVREPFRRTGDRAVVVIGLAISSVREISKRALQGESEKPEDVGRARPRRAQGKPLLHHDRTAEDAVYRFRPLPREEEMDGGGLRPWR